MTKKEGSKNKNGQKSQKSSELRVNGSTRRPKKKGSVKKSFEARKENYLSSTKRDPRDERQDLIDQGVIRPGKLPRWQW